MEHCFYLSLVFSLVLFLLYNKSFGPSSLFPFLLLFHSTLLSMFTILRYFYHYFFMSFIRCFLFPLGLFRATSISPLDSLCIYQPLTFELFVKISLPPLISFSVNLTFLLLSDSFSSSLIYQALLSFSPSFQT